MGEPPDRGGLGMYNSPIRVDNDKKLKLCSPGGKYLVMTRIKSSIPSDINCNLSNVSPFLIKKVVDTTCCGEVEMCKKLRNGTVLIKTKTLTQAERLIKLCSLSPTIEIEMSEHNSLNFSKGVVYSNDLREIPNEVILEEIKEQKAVKVEKILKRDNDKLKETGLVIITFASTTLPSELAIGYERVKIRPYIPLPMRCNKCFVYGHVALHCKNDKLCGNCGELFHTNVDLKEQCTKQKKCCNCKKNNCVQYHHSAFDKTCPTFLREKEIQAIITLEKVNRPTAITTYNSRNPLSNTSFANVVKSSSNMNTPSAVTANVNVSMDSPANVSPIIAKTPGFTRPLVNYSEVDKSANLTDENDINKLLLRKKALLLPIKTSLRKRNQMKQISKNKIKESTDIFKDSDSSEDNAMDFDKSG